MSPTTLQVAFFVLAWTVWLARTDPIIMQSCEENADDLSICTDLCYCFSCLYPQNGSYTNDQRYVSCVDERRDCPAGTEKHTNYEFNRDWCKAWDIGGYIIEGIFGLWCLLMLLWLLCWLLGRAKLCCQRRGYESIV